MLIVGRIYKVKIERKVKIGDQYYKNSKDASERPEDEELKPGETFIVLDLKKSRCCYGTISYKILYSDGKIYILPCLPLKHKDAFFKEI